MIHELQLRDLKPEFRLKDVNNATFEQLTEEAQRIIMVTGKATFYVGGVPGKTIEAPIKENESHHLESATLENRVGRKMIVTWKNNIQLVFLTVKSSSEIGRILTMLRESPYSFRRIPLGQPYDYCASVAQGKPVAYRGDIDAVGIYVPHPDLVKLASRHLEHLLKL